QPFIRCKLRVLGADQAQHDLLVLGNIFERLETAGALAVIFQKIAIDMRLIEADGSNAVIASLGHPHTLEIAATGVDGHRHRWRGDAGGSVPRAASIPW